MAMQHLSDERLIDVCFEEPVADTDRQHLAACSTCEERRAVIAHVLDDVTAAGALEADARFSDERLARQRARILQRIEREGRPAQLISFPAVHSGERTQRSRPATRWIAGAAAAGLIIGLIAGQLVRVLPGSSRARSSIVMQAPTVSALQAIPATLSEDEFLGRLEMVVEGSSGASLRPLDDLTPRVWEVAAQ
jgi:hypothetical protein